MSLPEYTQIEGALEGAEGTTPAETHGLLAALMVCRIPIHKKAWLDSLKNNWSSSNAEVQTHEQAFSKMFDVTEKAFKEGDFAFDLLLPDDELGIENRIDALAQWCQGFVTGLSLAGVDVQKHYSEEVDEALSDLTKMSCLAYDDETSGELETESALTELVEYARVAVMLLYECGESLLPGQAEVVKH